MVDACPWKSDKRLVPQDQVERLLSLLLKAEKRTWLANISPVNSSEHDDLQFGEESQNRNCSFVDTGSLLLKHGKCIKRIHGQFHDLDPRHYCVKVTSEITNPDLPSSQMKVVSSDDSNSTEQGNGSNSIVSSTSLQDSTGGPFTTKNPLFELYKNAVLCAQYPVLGASQAASPYSPASSPFTPSMQHGSSVPAGANSQKYRRRMSSASSDPGRVSPEVSISTLSEELKELVQKVFKLGKRQHKHYCDTEIPMQVPRSKDRPRFLVEELLSQQVVLERNHHPFYRVQAFMDNNIYGEWLIHVKERIEGLIRGFWQYSRPPVPELPLESPKYHEQYVELMRRLFSHENNKKEPHPVYGGAVPTKPLSSPACQLLKEFALRYGIGVLFCKISYLEYIVKYFENNLWYIEHTTISLQDVMDHVFICQEIFVEEEFKMLLSILSTLLEKTKYLLTKIRRIFPAENSPNEGVTSLVTLFKLTLESARQLKAEFPSVFTKLPQAQQFARNLAAAPACDLLASYVEEEIEHDRYERLKVKATEELGQNFSLPKLLLKSILDIQHEVSYYNTHYKKTFSRYFDVMELAAFKFYSLLMSDVEQLCENPPRTQRHGNVDSFMLCLAFRLSQLDKEWAEYIPYGDQRWRQSFQQFALQWLDATGHFFQRLIPQMISSDLWEAMEVNIDKDQERKRGRQTPSTPHQQMGGKSASLPSLTPSRHSAFKTVEPSGGSPAKSSAAKGIVKSGKSGKGKEPLQSRRYLGSSPPLRVKSPKRTRPGEYDSSSDEDEASVAERTSKLNVKAQIHAPRAQVHSSGKSGIIEPQTSSHGEPSKGKSPVLSVKVGPATQQPSGPAETGRLGEENGHPCTAQHGYEAAKENTQRSKIAEGDLKYDQPDDKGSITLDQQSSNPVKTSVKSGSSGSANDCDNEEKSEQPLRGDQVSPETHPDNLEESKLVSQVDDPQGKKHNKPVTCSSDQSESATAQLEESCVVKPLENAKGSGSPGLYDLKETENDIEPHTDPLDGSATKRAVEGPGSTSTEESRAVQFVESGESAIPNITKERLEQPSEVHSPTNEKNPTGNKSSDCLDQLDKTENFENRKVGQPLRGIENIEVQSSTSVLTNVREDAIKEDVGDVLHEGTSTSDCSSRRSRNQSTPFENDSIDESDSDSSIHTSDSFDFVEDKGKTKVKKESKTRTVHPIEDAVKSGKGSDPSNSCQTCPARNSCFGAEGDEGSRDVRKQGADEYKQSAPVCIPVPRNKRIDKLRATDAPNLSECGSFQTAFGSIHSKTSVETYHSARASPISSQSKDDSDHLSDSSHSRDGTPRVLPVSSSFVDVICAVNRLAAFACHLCEILCPDDSPQRSEQAAAAAACTTTGDDDLRHESLEIKRRLCHRLVQVMFSFVKLYSDNVLGMDTCGLPDELLTEILGERVQRHLRTQRDDRKLQGCRYNPSVRECCNTRDIRGTFIPPCEGICSIAINPGEFEPLTGQMGVRLTSVAILRSILPWLLDHVTSAISNPDSMVSDHHHISGTEYDHSLSYCETGPSVDGISISSAAEGRIDVPRPRADALRDSGVLNNSIDHLCRLEISQVKLLSYRINKLFRQLLRSLLDLNLPKYSIRKRLMPAMEFLSRELQRFHAVLYPDDFNKFLLDLWGHVARNFEEECHRLVRRKSSALQHSKLLLQAVAYLMKFFWDGLPYDALAAPMDDVVQQLQLYTTPTDRLTSMYQSFYRQVLIMQQQYRIDELTSSVSASSHQATANAPADGVIQAMRRDLHTTRKCFSGAALVEWVVNYVRDHGYDNLGLCIGSTETETGLELGQYLLQRRMMIGVCPPPRFNRQPSAERTRRDQTPEENAPTERGRVFVDENVQADMKVNNISAPSNRSSPASSSSSSSRSTRTVSGEGADDEYEDDDDDFLGSASDIWNRFNSAQSENETRFYNHPDALYKFISEEDTSRTEVKITLGIADRLNLPTKLKHILRVLYTRKNSDKAAHSFLKRLPAGLLDDALDVEGLVQCNPMVGVCQTL